MPMEGVDEKVDFTVNMPEFRCSGRFGASESLIILDGFLPHVYTSVLGGGERSKILIRGVTGFSGITCIEEGSSAIARNSPFGRTWRIL